MPDDDGQFPSQAELDAEDREDYYCIISWIRENRPETRLAGEACADWIIRVLAASPRAIGTDEQLATLPFLSIVRETRKAGGIWERRSCNDSISGWKLVAGVSNLRVSPKLPALLLYEPIPE